MAALTRLAGVSPPARPMRLAVRLRGSMSAIGSLIMAGPPSPAGLLDARNQPVAGHVPEADPADAELAIHGPGPAAQPAAQADLDALARQHQLGLVPV